MDEVLCRWHQLFKGTLLTQQYYRGERQSKLLQKVLRETAQIYRSRLMDISWFMRILNETIARQANREDNCTGRFWEGRFKSQALLDEAALAACMAYVDLNPIRAKIATTPESSDHTSIQQRIDAAKNGQQPMALACFIGNPRLNMPKGLPFELADYLQLVELTGRCIREGKRGFFDYEQDPILIRLGISVKNWLKITSEFRTLFHGAVDHSDALSVFCQHQAIKWRHNLTACQRNFSY